MVFLGCSSASRAPAVVPSSAGNPGALSQWLEQIVDALPPGEHGTDVRELYAARSYTPVWLVDGHPTVQARAVIAAMVSSLQKGLNPEDYGASDWTARLDAIIKPDASDETRARFDVDLTSSAAFLVSDLRIGRASPRPLPFQILHGAKVDDLATFIAQSLATSTDMPASLASVEPQYLGYQRTLAALRTYLALETQDHSPPLLPLNKAIHPAEVYAGLEPLMHRLSLLGDMPADLSPGLSGTYTGPVVEGVRHFQARHGLTVDGNLNNATIAELNVPLADRIVQLRDALERWRWLPANYPALPVAVNIPEFVLRVFANDHHITLRSNIVAGKAFGHQTPVFADQMKYIIFRPYWNVPLSITRTEIIPHIQKSSSYFTRERLEVTDLSGHVVTSGGVSPAMLSGMRTGRLLVRQKPGPANALGLIKFIFPNANNVYLHSTPVPQLFARARRDFSHGCIRVEKPAELAAWLLQDQPQWSVEAVRAAMETGPDNQQVNLSRPVPVVIVYLTAVVEESGEIFFFNDIYGLDHQLTTLLAKGRPYR